MAVFDWFKTKSDTSTPTKQQPARPAQRNWTEQLAVNRALTQGLYHNSYPGLKLAGSMAWAPIALPVFFMGVPVAVTDSEADKERIAQIVEEKRQQMEAIHIQCHREGTIWVWPRYSSREQRVVWDFIPDDSVTDIIRDINTGNVVKIITDEEFHLQVGYNTSAFVRRRRIFDEQRVTVEWHGARDSVPSNVDNRTYRNPIGMLPIPFANNADGDEVRGHSDYERIIPDLKSYHDMDLQEAKILAKFSPKMINQVNNVDDWLANNGHDSLSDVDVASTDLIMLTEGEKSDYIFPSSIEATYGSALKRRYFKIVEGSGIPEIIWGVKTEGNHASAEEQMDVFVQYVRAKRYPKNRPYQMLYESTLRLMAAAGEFSEPPEVTIEWNALDSLSEKTKAEIFLNFARGVSALVDAAAIPKEVLHKLFLETYPEATDDDFEMFRRGMSDMAKHKAFKDSQYTDILDLSGEREETVEPDDEI